ncbi:hypothetical protein [Psychrobacillus sp.]|uniref:hypothetical protein n=1 Tax=Psychrobacillus sp. TaxID=1871623 RepID=UPI0028BEF40C|nr:hypothetical protein [Psychrobacillus sp.]
MKKIIILIGTIVSLGMINWILSYAFSVQFFDIGIPYGIVALFIIYMYTDRSGAISRHMEPQIQGQIGVRMNITTRIHGTSFILIGSIVYFLLTLIVSFYIYKDYFIN